jgi:hypothetical protein
MRSAFFEEADSFRPYRRTDADGDIGENYVFTAFESGEGLFWTGGLYLKMPRGLPAGDKNYEHVNHIRDIRRKE